MDVEAAKSRTSGVRAGGNGGTPSKVVPSLFLLADRARLLTVWEAFRGTRRFSDYRQRTGLSDAVQSGRLRDLVDYGVLDATLYNEHPPRYEYRLTRMGGEFWPVGMAILEWQRRWGSVGADVKLFHVDCGPISEAEFGCAACGRHRLSLPDLHVGWLTPTAAPVPKANHPLHRYRKVSPTATKAIASWGEVNVVIGDRWSLNLLMQALLGVTRFADFQRQLSISPAQLSPRLSDLVEHDFLQRSPTSATSSHRRYLLRPKAIDLLPLLVANDAWVRRWFTAIDRPPVEFVHTACGSQMQPGWWCPTCGDELTLETLRADTWC